MKRTALLFFVLAGPLAGQTLPDHARFGTVLDRVWQDGLIDYAEAKASRSLLDDYIAEIGATSIGTVQAASRWGQLAFWINAYNACTMALVVDHYPIERRGGLGRIVNAVKGVPANSIQQIPNTWTRKFCTVAGSQRSLDEIEHEIVRPMGEPRIHFAINCAARSCPVLAPEPYSADRLDEQLDDAVRRLVNDPRHFSFDRSGPPTIHVNKVLDWFKEDFGGVEGVASFFMPYLSDADRAYAERRGPIRVTFRDYDWTLNDTAVFGSRP